MDEARKRLAKWFLFAVLLTALGTALGSCSATTAGGVRAQTPTEVFAQAAASYEIIQVSIEAAVTSGQLTESQKSLLKGIDAIAMDALQTGRAAIAAKDMVKVDYSTRILREARSEALRALGRSDSSGTILMDRGHTWQFNTVPMGG